MNPYFTQLPINIDVLDTTKFNLIPRRTFENKNYYSSINNQKYTEYLNNIFEALNPRDISYCEFPGAKPHIDHDNSKCAINHYYVTQNAETIFYKSKINAKPFALNNEGAACMYHPEDIIEESSFCAQPNSIWLLNVTEIHSISRPGVWLPGIRTFVKWRFDAPYEEIYQRLIEEIMPKFNT